MSRTHANLPSVGLLPERSVRMKGTQSETTQVNTHMHGNCGPRQTRASCSQTIQITAQSLSLPGLEGHA